MNTAFYGSLLLSIVTALRAEVAVADVPVVHLLPGGIAGPGETLHRDIASALGAARSGDVLVLDPGRYAGPGNRNLVVTEAVTIRGRGSAAETVVDCEGQGRAFELRGAPVVLRDLTVRNGRAREGAGVFVSAGVALLEGLLIEDCAADTLGGGISGAGDLRAVDCVLRRNRAPSGGGIAAGGPTRLEGCRLHDNRARAGGGMLFSAEFDNAVLERCLFLGNEASGDGGGFALIFLGAADLDRCMFLDNRADYGGAIYGTSLFGALRLTNSLVARNHAQRGAGGIFATPIGIVGCTIVDNDCMDTGAGGVRASPSSFFGSAMINSIVRDNRSASASLILRQVQTSFGVLPDENFTVLYCDVEGVVASPTNFDEEPLFVAPEDGDFHLLPGSPCIDSGITLQVNLPMLDIDGEPRGLGASTDIGFDEVPPSR